MADPAVRSVSSNANTGPTALAVTKPAGTADGDVLLAFVSVAASDTVTAPSGWGSPIATATNGGNRMIYVYAKIAASEPASQNWNTASFAFVVGIIAITDGKLPAHTSAIGTTPGSTASQVAPSVTTTVANCLIVSAVNYNPTSTSGLSATPPSGMAEQVDLIPTSTTVGLWLATVLQAAAAASGTKTFTMTQAGNVGCGVTLAIAPAAQTHTGAAVLPATATLAVTARDMKQATVALATSLSLASAGATTQHGASALALSATLATAGTMTHTSGVLMPATATLAADAQVGAILGQAALALAATLSPRAGITQRASQAITASATLQAAGVLGRPPPLVLKSVRPQAGTGSYGILPAAGTGRRR